MLITVGIFFFGFFKNHLKNLFKSPVLSPSTTRVLYENKAQARYEISLLQVR